MGTKEHLYIFGTHNSIIFRLVFTTLNRVSRLLITSGGRYTRVTFTTTLTIITTTSVT
nr:MAG TPA: hypothetical protein [Caudoviricetes sp.]